MEKIETIRKDPGKWYYWGRWNQVMLFTSPWFRYPKTSPAREMGLDLLTGYLKVLHGHYYVFQEDVDKIFELVQDKIKNSPEWFYKFFSYCDNRMKKMLELENGTDLKKFLIEMHDYLTCSMLVEFFDFGIGKLLKQMCEQEEVSFAEITRFVKPSRDPLLIVYKKELGKLDKKNIDEFVREHKWVGTHSFEGEPLTKEKVLEELKHVNVEGKKESKHEVPGKFKEIIRIVSELAYYRSNLMETVDKVTFSYWDKIAEIGKKKGLSYFDTVSMTHNELIDFIDTGKIPSNLKQRKKRFGIVSISKDKEEVLIGKDLDKELEIHMDKPDENVSELKGIAACKGVVRGQAKILTDVKHVPKVEKGDVLIAPETTPDYILAMNKAAAFVTEVGGLTSHAAILSREMNKPCVIGTKIATRVFKDGDIVEVDANKGIVRKVE